MEMVIGIINRYLRSEFLNQDASQHSDVLTGAPERLTVGALQDYMTARFPLQSSMKKIAGDLGVGLPPMIQC